MKTKVIAYDLGTGGIKTSLFSIRGELVASVFIPYETYYPQPDWQEQAPEDWWQSLVASTKQLLEKSGASPEEIVSLAISGHSLGVVPISKEGHLLRPTTPIWSDQRATQEAQVFFESIHTQEWYLNTGNGFPPACYSIFKIMWYKNHEPEMFARIGKVIGTKDYCNYKLTGKLCTDYSYASGCGAFDLKNWEYRPDYLEAAGLDPRIFPELLPSDAVIGNLTAEAAKETGLSSSTKVICGGVDNSCMALGAKGFRSGSVYTSLGSSAWVALIADKPVLDYTYKPYVFTHVVKGLYTSATCIFSAGNSLRWVRDIFCQDFLLQEKEGGENTYNRMNNLARLSPPGANGICFNPSLSGGSMLEPSPSLCGAFAGLKLSNNRGDIIRATMEGITLNLKKALQVLQSYAQVKGNMLIVGGGAKSPFWMQLFANIYGLPIEKTNIDQEAASLGAAALALKGAGIWKDYERIAEVHTCNNIYTPEPAQQQFYEEVAYHRFQQLTDFLGRFSE